MRRLLSYCQILMNRQFFIKIKREHIQKGHIKNMHIESFLLGIHE